MYTPVHHSHKSLFQFSPAQREILKEHYKSLGISHNHASRMAAQSTSARIFCGPAQAVCCFHPWHETEEGQDYWMAVSIHYINQLAGAFNESDEQP